MPPPTTYRSISNPYLLALQNEPAPLAIPQAMRKSKYRHGFHASPCAREDKIRRFFRSKFIEDSRGKRRYSLYVPRRRVAPRPWPRRSEKFPAVYRSHSQLFVFIRFAVHFPTTPQPGDIPVAVRYHLSISWGISSTRYDSSCGHPMTLPLNKNRQR